MTDADAVVAQFYLFAHQRQDQHQPQRQRSPEPFLQFRRSKYGQWQH